MLLLAFSILIIKKKGDKTRDGFKEGRPPIARAKIELAMGLLDEYSYKKVAEMTGISVATLARYRRKMKDELICKPSSE